MTIIEHATARAGLASALLLALLLGAAAQARPSAPDVAAQATNAGPLPALGLAAGSLTVSGLSSGGYMAGQFQVAFSSAVSGAAVLAAGPYGCSRGSVSTAVKNCSCPTGNSPWLALAQWLPATRCEVLGPPLLANFAQSALDINREQLDNPAALAGHRVWLLSGDADPVVKPALVSAAAQFYRDHGVPADHLHLEHVAGAGHGLPVPDGPLACGVTASPYLTRCAGEDAAGALLAWLLAPVGAGAAPWQPAVAPRAAGLRPFDQRPYRQQSVWDGLDDQGWLYVPAACERAGGQAAAACRLHLVFHGCQQGRSVLGERFVQGAGYNRWAEANQVVVLYPQVRASRLPASAVGQTYRMNPEGCWDFWGYTDPLGDVHGVARHFARRTAPQLSAVKRMVDALQAAPH